jgi:hypothetical protein
MRAYSVDIFQPLGLAALSAGDYNVVVSNAKLSAEKFGDAEIDTRILKVLACRADLNLGAASTQLREGVDSTRVSPLEYVFSGHLHIFPSHCAHILI